MINIQYPDNWEQLNDAQKLDALQDAIYELKVKYHDVDKRYWRDVMWKSVKVGK